MRHSNVKLLKLMSLCRYSSSNYKKDVLGLWRYMSVPNGQRGQLKIQTQHICSTFDDFGKKIMLYHTQYMERTCHHAIPLHKVM